LILTNLVGVIMQINLTDSQADLLKKFVGKQTAIQVDHDVEAGGCELCVSLGAEPYGSFAYVRVGSKVCELGEVEVT